MESILYSIFWKRYVNWCYFFFECLVDFSNETIWACRFLFQKDLTKNSIPLIVKGLIKLSISSLVSFGSLWFSRNRSISSNCQIYACGIVYSIPLISLLTAGSIVTSHFHSPHWLFVFSISLLVWLEVYQFKKSF